MSHEPHPSTIGQGLVAPYCAIPRDYLSDAPLLRTMGVLVSQHDQFGAIPPCPFLSLSSLERMRSGGAIPPPLARYHMRTRHSGSDALCDAISKRYCAIWGVSRTGQRITIKRGETMPKGQMVPFSRGRLYPPSEYLPTCKMIFKLFSGLLPTYYFLPNSFQRAANGGQIRRG